MAIRHCDLDAVLAKKYLNPWLFEPGQESLHTHTLFLLLKHKFLSSVRDSGWGDKACGLEQYNIL